MATNTEQALDNVPDIDNPLFELVSHRFVETPAPAKFYAEATKVYEPTQAYKAHIDLMEPAKLVKEPKKPKKEKESKNAIKDIEQLRSTGGLNCK